MNQYWIRKTTTSDLPALLETFAYAREFMRNTGNPNQWGDCHPLPELIEKDIANGTGYIIEDEKGILGTFAFIVGIDETYLNIEQGEWLNDELYGTIHRIAAARPHAEVFEKCIEFCKSTVLEDDTRLKNLRIDTHEDNLVMQKLVKRAGFSYCGIIYVRDHSPRLAYQLCIE